MKQGWRGKRSMKPRQSFKAGKDTPSLTRHTLLGLSSLHLLLRLSYRSKWQGLRQPTGVRVLESCPTGLTPDLVPQDRQGISKW